MKPILTVALVVLAAIVPTASAHASPNPPEYMSRLLHDYNDDWGSDAAGQSTRDGHDLLALDLREEFNQTLQKDALVFRFLLNYGYDGDSTKPELKDVLTFTAKGQTVTKEIRTQDNQIFAGTFDGVSNAFPLLKADGKRDGARFYVEATMKRETLGLNVGDKISNFFVQGYGGTQKADHMVGGYTLGGQKVDQEPPSEQSQPASYARADYALRGPTMYMRSEIDKTAIAGQPGENITITWRITNTLGRVQSFSLLHTAPEDVTVAFHGSKYAEDQLAFDLGAGISTTVHVYVTPSATSKASSFDIVALTGLGGRTSHAMALTIGDAPPPTTATSVSSSPSDAAPAPAIDALASLVALVVLVLIARRR